MYGVSKLVEQVLELLWSKKCWQRTTWGSKVHH